MHSLVACDRYILHQDSRTVLFTHVHLEHSVNGVKNDKLTVWEKLNAEPSFKWSILQDS